MLLLSTNMKTILVSVYLDINPLTNDPFYVGIGSKTRINSLSRNNIHAKLVSTFPHKKFIREVIYRDIPILEAWEIEKSLIKLHGKIINGTGILANIHDGGPLEFQFKEIHKWMEDRNYENTRKGKTYEEMYGMERANQIKRKQSKKAESKKKRIQQYGFTEKELKWFKFNSERRKNKQFTENEINHYRNLSIQKKGKTFKELYGENYIHPSKGKSYSGIHGADYIHPCLGKTFKEMCGQDYMDPRGNSFFVQINDNSPILFASERDMMKYFKCSKALLHKIKKEIFIVNENNSPKCNQPSGTTLKYISK